MTEEVEVEVAKFLDFETPLEDILDVVKEKVPEEHVGSVYLVYSESYDLPELCVRFRRPETDVEKRGREAEERRHNLDREKRDMAEYVRLKQLYG